MREPRSFVEPRSADELALRLHYPAWCHRYALEPTLSEFADTAWWRLFSLPAAAFDQVARRVGLTLMFAADQRQRLLRRAAFDVALVRWALERAHFVPQPAAAAVHGSVATTAPEEHAALSLCWCLDAQPALWSRMRLRFAREHVAADDAPARPRSADATVQAHLGRLWRTAARQALEEKSP